MKETKEGISVKKSEDISKWYAEVVQKAELADYSPVKGFMIIRPNAYSIWEKIQSSFDNYLKNKKIKNAYFPLLIPESFFKKEAEHALGFEPELAWIEKTADESSEGERLAIRPTSETIIYDSFSKWIRSWRDLPLKINQWCNVLRWEVKQTKPFLRTREFLWQEGHCVYETKEECDKEVREILEEYKKVCEDLLAIPVLMGGKTNSEKFAGAFYTTTVEALMPDGKALQMGTSHNLGQGFAKSFDIKFKAKDESIKTPWQSSWGISTRLIGALILAHGDDKGLVLPPNVAENKIAIIPITFKGKESVVLKKTKEIEKKLSLFGAFVDDREEYSPGWKFNEWEMKGIPLRIEIGPRDIEKEQITIVRRDNGKKEALKESEIKEKIPKILQDIQDSLFKKAKKFLDENIVEAKNYNDFKKAIKDRKIASIFFCEDSKLEEKIKDETGATSRCIPFNQKQQEKCIFTGKPAYKVFFAKSY
jgi:prolyl-tRNA synthetase